VYFMEEKCIFCNIQTNENNELIDKPLFKSDNFYIKLGKGMIIPGYLMIIPKEHVISMAYLTKEKLRKLFILLDETRNILEKTFNEPVIFYEAGTSGVRGVKFNNSIVHAHIHVAPISLSGENYSVLIKEMFLEPFDYRNCLQQLKGKPYSFLIDADNQGFASLVWDRQRQLFRKVLAKQVGKENAWNWREEKNESIQNIKLTIRYLHAKLGMLNYFHL